MGICLPVCLGVFVMLWNGCLNGSWCSETQACTHNHHRLIDRYALLDLTILGCSHALVTLSFSHSGVALCSTNLVILAKNKPCRSLHASSQPLFFRLNSMLPVADSSSWCACAATEQQTVASGAPNFAALHQSVVISPTLASLSERLQLPKIVPMAVDHAIAEIIFPTVERSVTIGRMTTIELVNKASACFSELPLLTALAA